MTHRRVPGGLAIALVVLAMIVLLSGIGALIAQSVAGFTRQLPVYQARLTEMTAGLVGWAEPIATRFGIDLSPDVLLAYFDPSTALVMVRQALSSLGGVLSNSFLILLTVIFILAEASSFPDKLRAALNNRSGGLGGLTGFGATVNRYVAIKTSISAATGLAVAVGLAVIGVDYPMLWGLLAFLLNFVPTIGSIIAAIPPVLLALVQLGPLSALVVALGFVALNVVIGNVIEPRVMGRGLGLSTLVVFLSLVFWGWVLGPIGMLLSIPLTMTAKMALDASPSTRWAAVLLGPAPDPSQAAPDSAGVATS
jgi:AI-2 transport protein TqsA